MSNLTSFVENAENTVDVGFGFTMASIQNYIAPFMGILVGLLFIFILIRWASKV